MPAMFTARYVGECALCGDPIDPGDEAGYIDDEVCCADCCDDVEDEATW